MGVDHEAGDLVSLVGDDGLGEELAERNIGERHPRRDHLFGAAGGNARQAVARARRGRLGEQIAQIAEAVARGVDGVAVDQKPLRVSSANGRLQSSLARRDAHWAAFTRGDVCGVPDPSDKLLIRIVFFFDEDEGETSTR